MRKILIVVALIVVCASLFAQAQITPYGSARAGYWLNMYDKDHRVGERTVGDFLLQNNSRFGVNFRNEGLTARVEYGMGDVATAGAGTNVNPSLRLVWARQQFEGWSLLIGQDTDGTNLFANQVVSVGTTNGNRHDINLVGYGVVDGGRNMMVRYRHDCGFYVAAMAPKTGSDPAGNGSAIDAFIPRLNIGYDAKFLDGDLNLYPTFVVQNYSYNKDFGNEHDGSVTSWLFSTTADWKIDAVNLRAQVNYGTNTGNMGYRFGLAQAGAHSRDANPNRATWDADKKETKDATTFGGFLMADYGLSKVVNLNLGLGYTTTSHDDFHNDATRLGVYLQCTVRAQRLRITPEIGLMNDGDSVMNNAEGKKVSLGSMTYFGTQLRMDF